jgi:hypothetical protein
MAAPKRDSAVTPAKRSASQGPRGSQAQAEEWTPGQARCDGGVAGEGAVSLGTNVPKCTAASAFGGSNPLQPEPIHASLMATPAVSGD